MTRNVLLILFATLGSACATPPVPTDKEPDAVGTVTPGPRQPAGATAVLLQQGRSQLAAGLYPEAAASLERAVRIEPANPWLWLELARVHLAAGDTRQAEGHARKALTLAGTDDEARRAAQRFLDALPGR